MNNYITTYDNLISEKYCNELIQKFEDNTQCHSKEDNTHGKWKMSFTQINFYQHDEFKDDMQKLDIIFRQAVNHYVKDNSIEDGQWPTKFKFEQIRMKRYMPNTEDRFDIHVDVTDHDSARRFLVVFFYLNDDFEGGETVFPQLKVMAQPKPARLIIFPPMWNWLHKANPILSGSPKYIVGTLLHYV